MPLLSPFPSSPLSYHKINFKRQAKAFCTSESRALRKKGESSKAPNFMVSLFEHRVESQTGLLLGAKFIEIWNKIASVSVLLESGNNPELFSLYTTSLSSLTKRECQALTSPKCHSWHRGHLRFWGRSLSSHFSSNSIEVKRLSLKACYQVHCSKLRVERAPGDTHQNPTDIPHPSSVNTINEYCPDKQWSCLAWRRRWQGRK